MIGDSKRNRTIQTFCTEVSNVRFHMNWLVTRMKVSKTMVSKIPRGKRSCKVFCENIVLWQDDSYKCSAYKFSSSRYNIHCLDSRSFLQTCLRTPKAIDCPQQYMRMICNSLSENIYTKCWFNQNEISYLIFSLYLPDNNVFRKYHSCIKN